MKLTSLIRKTLVGVACISFMIGATARAEGKFEAKNKHSRQGWQIEAVARKPKVILVEVTGSRIPQRVVIGGQQVNSAYPLLVIQGNGLLRSGSTNVSGILTIDPSITFGGARSR